MIRWGICNELFENWTLADTCRAVRAIGYDGIELAPFTLAPLITEFTPTQRREARGIVSDSGLEIIGLHWLLAHTEGFALTSPDGAVRQRTTDYLRALIEATHDLGGRVMVFGSPRQRDLAPGQSTADGMRHAAEVFARLTPDLDACGVDLCVEPLGPAETNFLTTCAQAMTLIQQIDHPRVRLQLDVKAQSTEPGTTVPALIARHAAAASHFHAQDVNRRGPGMGAVDFRPIVRALVDAGYDRWVSVEAFDFTPGAEPTAIQGLACLQDALSAATGPP